MIEILIQFLCVLHVCKLVYVVVPDVEYGENVDYRGDRTRSCALDEYRGAQAQHLQLLQQH